MGLYDMIMLKDNHIDFAGGIEEAILKTNQYLNNEKLDLKIEIETRDLNEVKKVLKVVKAHEKNILGKSTTNKEVINGHKTTIIGRFFIKMSIIS